MRPDGVAEVSAQGGGAGSCRVLIASADRVARKDLARILGEYQEVDIAGYAATANEAIGQAEKLSPDIVFLDLDLPGGNPQVTQALCRILTWRGDIYVVAAPSSREVVKRLGGEILAGARDFCLKPIDPQMLDKFLRWRFSRDKTKGVIVD